MVSFQSLLRYFVSVGILFCALCPTLSYAKGDYGYYLKLEVGSSNPVNKSVKNQSSHHGQGEMKDVTFLNKAYSASPVFGVGVGYQVNKYIGFDMTWGYYLARSLKDRLISDDSPEFDPNIVLNRIRSWSLLFNTSITPYRFQVSNDIAIAPVITAGLGYANNHIEAEREETGPDSIHPEIIYADRDEPVGHGFAWQAGAGLQAELSHHVVLGVTYRFLSLGRLSKDRKMFEEQIHVRDIIANEVLLSAKYIF